MVATKKTTTTVKTTKTKKVTEVKDLAGLKTKLATKRQDLMTSQKSRASGELVNYSVLKGIRKDIARLLTSIHDLERQAKKETK